MPYCEICGRWVDRADQYELHGAVLVLCPFCAARTRARKIVQKPISLKRRPVVRPTVKRPPRIEESEWELVEDWAERIRRARQKLGLSIEELAKKIGVSPNYLRRVERGETEPDIDTLERLERVLGVSLRTSTELESLLLRLTGGARKREPTVTLADVVFIRKRKS